MYDHRYVREDGSAIPVAQMTDQELTHLMSVEFIIVDDAGCESTGEVTPEQIMERLRIEVVRRSLGL